MPIGPPKTVAQTGKDRMMGAGATPSPTKPDQAGGAGVKCGACGHYHKPGSICSNKSIADDLHFLMKGNEYHEPGGSPGGIGGRFAKKPTGASDSPPTKTEVLHTGPHGSGDGDGKKTAADEGVVSTSSGVQSKESSPYKDEIKVMSAFPDSFGKQEDDGGLGDLMSAEESTKVGIPAQAAAKRADQPKATDQGTVAGKVGAGTAPTNVGPDPVQATDVDPGMDQAGTPDFASVQRKDHGDYVSSEYEGAPFIGDDQQFTGEPLSYTGQKPKDDLSALTSPEDAPESPQGDSLDTQLSPKNQAAAFKEKIKQDRANAEVSSPEEAAASTEQLDRLVKEEKYGKTYDRAVKQGFSPQDAHSAASQATGGHSQQQGWQSPGERSAAAKQAKTEAAAQAKQQKAGAKQAASARKQRIKDQGARVNATMSAEDVATKQQKADSAAKFKQDKANAKQLVAGARGSLNAQDKQAKVIAANQAKQDKILNKPSNQGVFEDLQAARDLPSNEGILGDLQAARDLDPASAGTGSLDPSSGNGSDILSDLGIGGGQSKMQQQRDATDNLSSLGATPGTPAPQDSRKFKQANAALGKQQAAEAKQPGAEAKQPGAAAKQPGAGGAAQGKTPNKGLPFSQMYGAGAGIGSSMTEDTGGVGPTAAFAAQRAHQLLNPDLRPHTAPAMAGTGTGARTKDRHAGGTSSPLAPGMGKSVESLLGM